jgi:hypothetical protein
MLLGERDEMNLPAQYACDPPWWVVIWSLAAAGAVMILVALHWIEVAPGLVVAVVLMSLVSLVTFRRLAIRRYVGLTEDALLLPTGFLQLRAVRIPYDAVDAVWEARWALGVVLYIRTGRLTYEVPCGITLNSEDYAEVRDFLIGASSKRIK